MTPLRKVVFGIFLLLLVGLSGWLFATRGDADDVQTDLAQARAHLAAGARDEAATVARAVLAREPLHGEAFALLARALADNGTEEEVLARYEIAVRRAPRDPHTRSWLAAHHLRHGDYASAMRHLDALMTVSPRHRDTVLAALGDLAADPQFADAIARHFAQHPRWRAGLLRHTQRHGAAGAVDTLHGALGRHGQLDDADIARWLDHLIGAGRWGEAYAHWAGTLAGPVERLQQPWNGDFSRPPSSAGFDWRLRRTPGVVAQRIALDNGHAMRFTFLGRPVAAVGLEQPLLLAPGPHRLHVRMRTVGLRASRGLEWSLTCGDRTPIATGARIQDASGWRDIGLEFTVPDNTRCAGQWLRLVNPAPRGVAQALRGELHVADVRIERIH